MFDACPCPVSAHRRLGAQVARVLQGPLAPARHAGSLRHRAGPNPMTERSETGRRQPPRAHIASAVLGRTPLTTQH